MDDNSQAEVRANPYLPNKDEFKKAILESAKWTEVADYILDALYGSLSEQPVVNKLKGHLLVSHIGIREPANSNGIRNTMNFHFAILTDDGHVTKSE